MSNLRNAEGLKENSKKKILFDCDICGKEVEQAYNNYIKQSGNMKLCRSCRNKNTANKMKAEISKSMKNRGKDKEYRKKISSSLSKSLKSSGEKRENRAPVNKTSGEDVLKLFERFSQLGFTLLTTENDGDTKAGKIHCECSKKHEHFYSIGQLKTVKKCHLCLRENAKKKESKREKKAKENLEKLERFFHDYEITKVDYDGTRDSKLLFKCKEGHIFEYPNGHGKMNSEESLKNEICPECFKIHRFDGIKKEMESEGYSDIVITKHKNKNYFIEFVCPQGHHDTMFVPNGLSGQRCGRCFLISSTSKKEQEVRQFIEDMDFETINNDRTILNGKEIDIYIPSKNLGLEFNGLYGHSTLKLNDKQYHQQKTILAREKNIKLIQISENHGDEKKDVIKSILKGHLDVLKKKIADKCIVKELTYKDANDFYSKNSYIVPEENSTFYALEDKEILCVIEVQKESILSFAFKNNIKIISGLDKFKEKLKINKIMIDLKYGDETSLGIENTDKYITQPMCEKIHRFELGNTGNLICDFNNREIRSIEISEEKVLSEYDSICKKQGNYSSVQMYSSPVLFFQGREFYKNELEKGKDPIIREKLYSNRLKYIGKTPEQLSNKNILLGLKIAGLSKSFSHFSPLWIKAFIEEFNIGSIYDPCGGGGHRLLGAANIRYIYNDINKTTYENAIKMSTFLNIENKKFYNCDAAAIDLSKEHKVDCMFTCPPYFNLEKYSSIGAENLSLDEFKQWGNAVIKNSLNICTKYVVFVVSTSLDDEIKYDIPKSLGLTLIKEQELGSKKNHFQRARNSMKNTEHLFVFEV